MEKPLLVMKFGGTSVGSPERVRGAAELAAQAAEEFSVVVVASAMSSVTDALLEGLAAAREGDQEAVEATFRALEEKHFRAARELLPAERLDPVRARIRELLDRYERVARGVLLLGEQPLASVDQALPTGERLSTLLLAETLRSIERHAELVDGSELIVTDEVFGAAAPLLDATAAKARKRLRPLLDRDAIPVVTGFNAASVEGRPTTLGRGGSDYSASILAGALDASELWIWTDVDGILTADPRVAAEARVLPEATYNEAAELAYAGAKVLHQSTLAPVIEKNIPVWIKNSFAPDRPGTRISSRRPETLGPRAITSLSKVALISIEAVSISQSGAAVMARALGALARAKVEVLLLSRSSFRQNFCVLVRAAEVDQALDGLRSELALELAHGYVHPIEVDRGVGLLAAVGEGMRGTPGLAGKLFTAMSERGINIIAIAQGSSELAIGVVVRKEDLDEAVRAVHRACGLDAADER